MCVCVCVCVLVSSNWRPLTGAFKQYPWNPLDMCDHFARECIPQSFALGDTSPDTSNARLEPGTVSLEFPNYNSRARAQRCVLEYVRSMPATGVRSLLPVEVRCYMCV